MIIDVKKHFNYQTIESLSAWKSFHDMIKREEAAHPGEDIVLDFTLTTISNVNDYLKELIYDDQVKFRCVRGSITFMTLGTMIKTLLRISDPTASKIDMVIVEAPKTLNKKELAQLAQTKKFDKAIAEALDPKQGQSLFVPFTVVAKDCGLDNFKFQCRDLPTFFDRLHDYCKNRGVVQLIVSLKGLEYSTVVIEAACKQAMQRFAADGMELIFSDCDATLTGILKIYKKMSYANGTVEDVIDFIETLGLGRVVLMTKLKSHRSTDTKYRQKDEVEAQFIGIITQITPTDVTFAYAGYGQLKTFHDLLVQYGDPDEFDPLVLNTVTISYTDLGVTNLRIASKWHINLFDGATKGDAKYNYVDTYTAENITCLTTPDKVVLPEFIRRSLKSWAKKFNEKALMEDIKSFQKSLKK